MGRTFIIVEPDPIVSMDLAGILKSVTPESDLMIAQSMPQARRLVLDGLSDIATVINASMVREDDVPFVRWLASRSSHMVFLGGSLDIGVEVKSVQTPFTSDMVISALSSDASPQPGRPPEART